jgi:hypothetical protein
MRLVALARVHEWITTQVPVSRKSLTRSAGVKRRRWPAVRFESASGSSPTDAGAGAVPVDPAVPYLAARSPEKGSLRAASEPRIAYAVCMVVQHCFDGRFYDPSTGHAGADFVAESTPLPAYLPSLH